MDAPGIGSLAWLSWYSLWRSLGRAPLAFVVAVIAVAAADWGRDWLANGLQALPATGWLASNGIFLATILVAIAVTLVQALGLAGAAVAVHRVVILGEAGGATAGQVLNYGAYLAVLLLLWQFAGSIQNLTGVKGSSLLVLAAAAGVAGLAIRCSLIFPSIAAGLAMANVKQRVEDCWEAMRGHGWRCTATAVLAALPLLAAGWTAAKLTGGFEAPALRAANAVQVGVLETAAVALAAAVASWIYLWAIDHPYARRTA